MELIRQLHHQAIKAAREKSWEKAIKVNLELLKLAPKNTPALNRLAWAYTALGKIKQAKETYRKVLKIEASNIIARKNLKKLEKQKADEIPPKKITQMPASLFLEESGKTSIISLTRTAPPERLATLYYTEPVMLVPQEKLISVQDNNGNYLGCLPRDISKRLIFLIENGNQYQAWVKSTDQNSLKIFIKEVKRNPKFKNELSFTSG